ncbi:MAG: L-threonylcarbamoyladenylate synthase [Gammaproteobacteria bacterium]|nr:L-threonylcarbamoyladenylate synthase [Gammaproteobacteria bacterium]
MSTPPILRVDPRDRAQLDRIATHLEEGGLLGYPTETVYGFGAEVTSRGIRAVRKLKGRGEAKPFLVLVPDRGSEGTARLDWTPSALALSDAVWPGPLTLVLRDPGASYPNGVRSAEGGVAVRVSSDPFVTAFMRRWRRPLLSTSANRAGDPPAGSAGAVRRLSRGGGADRLWIVDGGPRPEGEPSTIVDCTGPVPRLLREGALPLSRLLEVERELVH